VGNKHSSENSSKSKFNNTTGKTVLKSLKNRVKIIKNPKFERDLLNISRT
jgi:hypothetical protein